MSILNSIVAFFLSWQGLAVALASGTLAVVTYLVGIRIGKDSADRAVLRELYQKLFSHFKEISERLASDIPKQYTHWRNRDGQYIAPAREMFDNGTLQILPAPIVKKVKEAEDAYLKAAFEWKKSVEGNLIPLVSSALDRTFTGNRKPQSGKSYQILHCNALLLWDDDKFEKFADSACRNGIGLAIELAQETNLTNSVTVYPNEYTEQTIRDFLKDTRKAAKEMESLSQATQKLFHERTNLDSLVLILEKRIRDPNPFWQTIAAAVAEPFRG